MTSYIFNRPNNTLSSQTKWAIEVYRFASDVPQQGQSAQNTTTISIATSPGFSDSVLQQIAQQLAHIGNTPAPVVVPTSNHNNLRTLPLLGIQSVQCHRSKSTPAATCVISLVGPLDESFVIGNWIVVSAVNEGALAVRFIGQIEVLNFSYVSQPDGNIVLNTVMEIKEWSSILTSKFLYDVRSAAGSNLASPSQDVGLTFTQTVASQAGDLGGNRQAIMSRMDGIAADSFDPFEAVHMILNLMGAVDETELLRRSALNLTEEQRQQMAGILPPQIPVDILRRVTGQTFNNDVSVSANAYHDMVKVITGIKAPAAFSSSDWNGVFNADGQDNSIQRFKEQMEQNYIHRPYQYRGGSILSSLMNEMVVWDIVSSYCDSAFNEVYTDLWYSTDATGTVYGQPVIVVRDKPFMMRRVLNRTEEFIPFQTASMGINVQQKMNDHWSYYDDLPRVRIQPAAISQADIKVTSATSPNYFSLTSTSPQYQVTDFINAIALNIHSMVAEQERFGGQECIPEIQFANGSDTKPPSTPASADVPESTNSAPNSGETISYYTVLVDTLRVWHGYLYRMGEGQIILHGDIHNISVGFNVQFQIGYFDLVGHVESFSTSYSIDSDGSEHTTTTVQLSRIVWQPANTGNELRFLPMNAWGRLFDSSYPETNILQ